MIYIKLLIPFFYFFSILGFAGVKDVYEFKWLDPKKKVFVLQNKIHKNKKSSNFSLGYGWSELSDFQDTRNIHFMADYYLSEEWGLELFYSSYSNANNSSYDAIQKDTGGQVIPHIVKFNAIYGVNLMFSPFYGKINTFNAIFYIDWNFGLGVAVIDSEDNTQSFDLQNNSIPDYFLSKQRIGVSLKTQLRWHLTDLIKLNLDYINYFANLPEPLTGEKESLKRSSDLILSIGLKF